MQQQPEVTALHQAEAVSDKADSAIAKIVGLPGAGREATNGEEDFCDLAIARLVETTVERTQGRERVDPVSPASGLPDLRQDHG